MRLDQAVIVVLKIRPLGVQSLPSLVECTSGQRFCYGPSGRESGRDHSYRRTMLAPNTVALA